MNNKFFLALCVSFNLFSMELEHEWELIEPVEQEKEQVMQLIKQVQFRPTSQIKGKDFPKELRDIEDNVLPIHWYNITEQRKASLAPELQSSIKQVLYFNSTNNHLSDQELLRNKRLVLFLIHGTFSEKSPQFSNVNHATMQSALRLAINIESEVNSIEVVTVNWSGQDSDEGRINGGKNLAQLISIAYKDPLFTKFYALGHSHGGNVIKAATHEIKKGFERVYFIFTPVRADRPEYSADMTKINGVMNFWSSGDSIQYAGSFERGQESWSKALNRMSSWSFSDIGSVDWLKGGRKVEAGLHKKVNNIRVQYDGQSPSHIQKDTLINYIPVITSFLTNFYKLNFDFDINIDPKAPDLAQAIYIVIRHPLHLTEIPGLKGQDEKTINTVAGELERELAVSKQEAARFKQKYKKDIGEKGWRVADYAREAKLLIFGH